MTICTTIRQWALAWTTAGFLALGLAGAASAQAKIDAHGSPNAFVEAVGEQILDVLRKEPPAQRTNLHRINELVNQYVMPYVHLAKTTRLAAGRYWNQATPQQQKDLIEAFKGTLIRTYSGALADFDPRLKLTIHPFRGDPESDDAVVRSTLTQGGKPPVDVGYRLERTPEGWKIYDLNVEGIWLIQNYRNQFADQISKHGVQGLIDALNQQNR